MRAPASGGVPNTGHRTASRVGSPSKCTPPQKSAGVIHTQGQDDRRNRKREAPGQWTLSGEPKLEPYTRCHGNTSSYIRQDLTPRTTPPRPKQKEVPHGPRSIPGATPCHLRQGCGLAILPQCWLFSCSLKVGVKRRARSNLSPGCGGGWGWGPPTQWQWSAVECSVLGATVPPGGAADATPLVRKEPGGRGSCKDCRREPRSGRRPKCSNPPAHARGHRRRASD